MPGAETTPDVAKAFSLDGECIDIAPLGRGHIHDTYVVTFALPGGDRRRYVLQRINAAIFPDPGALMANIVKVTERLAAATAALPLEARPWREVLRVVSAQDGSAWYHAGRVGGHHKDAADAPDGPQNAEGAAWRLYHFVEGARPYQEASNPGTARRAAAAFGAFQRLLGSLEPSLLHETLPRFHELDHRLQQLEAASTAAEGSRRHGGAAAEIDFAREHGPRLASVLRGLVDRGLPTRVVHDDCKLNNVLFDDESGRVACVVDLDTVMPGHVLFDFGDMVRTMTCPAAEDEPDLERVRVDLRLLEAVAVGYLSEAGGFLTPTEKESLAIAGEYMSFIIGLRFLTDHLVGDAYFKTRRPGQNLQRARVQFRLAEVLGGKDRSLVRLLERVVDGGA